MTSVACCDEALMKRAAVVLVGSTPMGIEIHWNFLLKGPIAARKFPCQSLCFWQLRIVGVVIKVSDLRSASRQMCTDPANYFLTLKSSK